VSVLYVLVPLALVLVVGFVIAFVWGARTGQFDDLSTPAYRPLLDDPPPSGGSSAIDRSPPETTNGPDSR
jgi:cbb3-type cytochrome oxidase maturation protein